MRKYIRFETENLVHFINLRYCPAFIQEETGEELEEAEEILDWFTNLYDIAELVSLEIEPPSVAQKEEDGFLTPIF